MAASEVNGVLSGLVKRVYSKEGVIRLLADEDTMQNDFPFMASQRIGEAYQQPVTLATEQGVGYGAAGSTFTVPAPSTFVDQQAAVGAYQIVIASKIDYDTYFRTQNGDESAFDSAARLQVEEMAKSGKKRTEISMIYGGDYLALAQTSTNPSAGVVTLTVGTNGSWAAGIWTGSVNATIDFWQAGGTVKVNTNVFTVTGINQFTKTITLTGTGGTATADATAVFNYVVANPGVGGPVFGGSGVTVLGDQEMVGLKLIASNLTGTLFGISATSYDLWAGNTVNLASSAMTFAKIQDAVATLVARGLKGNLTIYVNPFSWANLLTDQAALRMYDSSYSSADVDNGSETITFHSQNGKLMIKSHIYIKEGDALFLPPKHVKRIGSTDWTFGVPGSMNGQVWFPNADTSVSYRAYAAQSVFVEKPAQSLFMTGISNS